jgi:L-cystine transport system permease protein
MNFDPAYMLSILGILAACIPVTLQITAAAVAIGLFLGLLLTMGQLLKNRILNTICVGYIAFIRGTPALLLIMLVYYGLPLPLKHFGIDINGLPQIWFAVLALSLNAGGYMSESMRSAYLAVHSGQYEAGLSVGMSAAMVNRRIIIPQACVMALPNLGNQVISALKHSALVYAIGITDVFQKGQAVASFLLGLRQVEIFIVITGIYWLISIATELLFAFIEKKFRYLIP